MKSYTHFTLSERESLQQYIYERKSYREIAKLIGKSPSSICREITRNVGNNKNVIRQSVQHSDTLNVEKTVLRRQLCNRKHLCINM